MPLPTAAYRTLAALSFTQLVGWGATFWLPAVTGPAMAADLGIDLAFVMAGPTIMLLVIAVVSLPLGTILERFGARPVMVLGSVLGCLGLSGLSLADGQVSYVLAWLVTGFAGACMLSTPAQVAVIEVAGTNSRQALSMLILAGAVTSTIIWPLSGLLQAQWGWRTTTLAYGLVMLLICAPLHWTVLARRRRERKDSTAKQTQSVIDRPKFVLLALGYAANGFFTWGFALIIIVLLEANGLDHVSAVTAASFIGIAQLAGRLVDFVVGKRMSILGIALVGFALFPAGLIVLLVTGELVGAMTFAVLYGVASGITTVTRATLPLQIFSPDAYARASARLAVPLNLSFAASPPVFAAVLTSAGPHAALWLALVVSIFSLMTLWLLSRLPD